MYQLSLFCSFHQLPVYSQLSRASVTDCFCFHETRLSPLYLQLDLQSHNSSLQVLTHCQVSGSERNHFVFPLYCATQLTPAFLAIFCFIRHFCIQYFAIAIWIVLRSLKPLSLKLNGSLCQSLHEPPELLLSVD